MSESERPYLSSIALVGKHVAFADSSGQVHDAGLVTEVSGIFGGETIVTTKNNAEESL